MKATRASSRLGIPGVIHWGGLPVPYVAAWSSETHLYFARDPLVQNRPALFRRGKRGEGKPIFGRMDEARARVVVCKRLCQVCARPFKNDGYVIDRVYGTFDRAPLVHEPATCRNCFLFSVAECPGIARMFGDPKLIIARVRTYQAIAVALGPAETADADANLNAALARWKGEPPIGYCRPALLDYDVLDYPIDNRDRGGDEMKATIESTEQLISINGVPARVWIGVTERGIPIQLAITRVAVHKDEDASQFEQELLERHAMTPEPQAFSFRMIL